MQGIKRISTLGIRRFAGIVCTVSRDRRGVSLIEFALVLPLLLILAGGGIELTNYVVTYKKISEVAEMVADNASRLGASSELQDQPVTEKEINDIFLGAVLDTNDLDIKDRGRIILSSLEVNADGGQWIHWQRCYGALDHASQYGVQGQGKTGNDFPGMGPSDSKVVAEPGSAVMFVEIEYSYKQLWGISKLDLHPIHETATFAVRTSRNLTPEGAPDGVTNPDHAPRATC